MRDASGRSRFTVVAKDYDFLSPLTSGAVSSGALDLVLDRGTPMNSFLSDPSIVAAEMSLSRYLIGLAEGRRDIVGLPLYVYRGFRHRSFFVRSDSELTSLQQLSGCRIGVNSWPDTGNTWARAALREGGVDPSFIKWTIAGIGRPGAPDLPQGPLPTNITLDARHTLVELLSRGDVDALLLPFAPPEFYREAGIRRLLPDFAAAEEAYFQRTALFPAHHIIAVRRDFFEENRFLIRTAAELLVQSWHHWWDTRLKLAEATPWQLHDMEHSLALLGPSWQLSLEPRTADERMLRTLCEEQTAQSLVSRAIDPVDAFREFYALTDAT